MDKRLSLRELFFKQAGEREHPLPHEDLAAAFLQGKNIDFSQLKSAVLSSPASEEAMPWELAERWRELLAFNLVAAGGNAPSEYLKQLQGKAQEYLRRPFWEEFQLLSALRAINCRMLEIPLQASTIYQLGSGAVPLDSGGHWQWGEVPHTRFHAELGVLWCLLGKLTGCQQYRSAAARLANWHLNTLAYDLHPFQGLFIQESDASLSSLFTWNYLLFHSVAHLGGRPDLESIAQKQLEFLEELPNPHGQNIPLLGPLIESWVHRLGDKIEGQNFCLSSYILDSHTNLVGIRSPSFNVVCTLYGGRTGMGAVRAGDVQIVNYGPQHLPLGECRSFGIEGGYYSQKMTAAPALSAQEGTFMLERSARLASLPSSQQSGGAFNFGKHSEMWVSAAQYYKHEMLRIDAKFCGFKGCETLAFSLFAKCQACKLENPDKYIKPKSFDRYQGHAQKVSLLGEKTSLTLEASHPVGEMQIIPLAGGDNFWGADFLIAFELLPGRREYSWCIENAGFDNDGKTEARGQKTE